VACVALEGHPAARPPSPAWPAPCGPAGSTPAWCNPCWCNPCWCSWAASTGVLPGQASGPGAWRALVLQGSACGGPLRHWGSSPTGRGSGRGAPPRSRASGWRSAVGACWACVRCHWRRRRGRCGDLGGFLWVPPASSRRGTLCRECTGAPLFRKGAARLASPCRHWLCNRKQAAHQKSTRLGAGREHQR